MRLVFRIDSNPISSLRRLPAGAALCAVFALAALPDGANARESVTAGTLATMTQPETDFAANETFAVSGTGAAWEARDEPDRGPIADLSADGMPAGSVVLDDQMRSRRRGGAGMVIVSATPQLVQGNAVTLWDEIAPPSPRPVPVDAARAAQGNVANYQRT